MFTAMALSTLGNEFLSVTLSPYFINFYNSQYLGIRSAVVVSQGWYYSRIKTYGSYEDLANLNDVALLACLYFIITFYLVLF